MDVALKSNVSNICAYANKIGYVLDVCNKFVVISSCFTIRHHR